MEAENVKDAKKKALEKRVCFKEADHVSDPEVTNVEECQRYVE